MNKLQANINLRAEVLNRRWKRLGMKQQRSWVAYAFLAYTAITVAVVVKVCLDAGNDTNKLEVAHINNPTIDKRAKDLKKADSLLFILKHKSK